MALSFELSTAAPYTLHAIENAVKRVGAAGAFVLDQPEKKAGTIVAGYVGRSDTDVAKDLERHVKSGYRTFAFTYASSPMDAYKKECEMWHEWKPAANPAHPLRPAGTSVPCMICGK